MYILLFQKSIINYGDKLKSIAIEYGPALLKALLVLIIGFWVIKRIVVFFKKSNESVWYR